MCHFIAPWTCLIPPQTWSAGKISTWIGPHITATDPAFDFQELLKQSVERAQVAEYDFAGLFSLSPLSSPESLHQSSLINPSLLESLCPSSPATHPSHTLEQEAPFLSKSSASQKLHVMPTNLNHQPVDRVKKRKRQSHDCQKKSVPKRKKTSSVHT